MADKTARRVARARGESGLTSMWGFGLGKADSMLARAARLTSIQRPNFQPSVSFLLGCYSTRIPRIAGWLSPTLSSPFSPTFHLKSSWLLRCYPPTRQRRPACPCSAAPPSDRNSNPVSLRWLSYMCTITCDQYL